RMSITVGTGLLTVRLVAVEAPPDGAGLKTVIENVPAACTSAAVSCALTCVALTRVVGRSAPPRRTIELLLKFVPFTVNVNAASPAILLAGTLVVRVGAGLLTVRLATLVEGPPAGVWLETTKG